ncbi:MAG: Ig-like domain-containing protein [Gemmatimonadetes bacterium]|nr:Ig-like domain-containing protein [Gemmatimonadota bacterium]
MIRRALVAGLILSVACGGDGPGTPSVKEVTVSAVSTTLQVGATTQLSAQVIGLDGLPTPGARVAWSSLSPSIVTVSAAGIATAVSAGQGTVRASSGGRSGQITITVAGPPVASVAFDRDSVVLTLPAGNATLVPIAKDAAGRVINNATFFYSSDAPKVATISQLGVVTAVAAGTAVISANTEALTATIRVRVTANVTGTSPRITAVTQLVAGGSAVVTGSNFASSVGGNSVLVEGVATTVTAATTTQLSITLPVGAWPCDLERPVTLQVNANNEVGVAAASLRTATQRALEVGQSVVLSAAADARCNELSNTGGAYLVTVYNVARAVSGGEASFTLRGVPVTSTAAASTAAREARAAAASVPTVPLTRPTMALVARANAAARQRVADARHADVLRRSVDFARAHGSPTAAWRRMRSLSEEGVRPAAARANQLATPGSITQLKIPNLDAQSFCTSNIAIGARTAWVGQHAIIVEDTISVLNGVPSLKGQLDSLYAQVGQEFDNTMWPILTQDFGNPLAMDKLLPPPRTGMVVMLFSPRVNSMLGGSLTGFVASCDFFPVSQAPSSNEGEFFYAIMPTSLGAGIGAGTRGSWMRDVRSTIIHEVKHITSFGERLSRNADFEELWLEEGLARHAEEQFARTIYGTAWKANTKYQASVFCDVRTASSSAPQCAGTPLLMLRHFDNLYQYLQAPDIYTMLGRSGFADATFYGTSWSMVRWMMDQYATTEPAFLSALVQSTRSGVANLEARVPGHPWEEMFGEWALSLYTDDYPGVTFANSRLQVPSWNMRDEFAGLCADLGACGSGSLGSVYPVAYPFEPRRVNFGTFSTTVGPMQAGTFSSWYLNGAQAAPQLLDLRGAFGSELPSQLRIAIVRVQ